MTTPSTPRTPVSTLLRERWLAIVLAVLTIMVIAQNRNRVDINLFWLHVSMRLWLVLFLIAAIGAVIGFLVARRRYR